ncbi:hypothetical protein BT93_G0964 [Corymbia citriodora subsp. variegata]|nr:hypothetical protein BT93_G0964 [Corymbia citriodora subsp. variegata]
MAKGGRWARGCGWNKRKREENQVLPHFQRSWLCSHYFKPLSFGCFQPLSSVMAGEVLVTLTNGKALTASGCDAIHITEIETPVEFDTFLPMVDTSVFQPCYSSFLIVENNIQ